MNQIGTKPVVSLVRLLSRRLTAVAVMAIVLQIGVTGIRSYFDEIDLAANYVRYEARLISGILGGRDHGRLPARYSDGHSGQYAFRILRRDGSVLGEHNSAVLAGLSPWRGSLSDTQDFWLRRPDAKQWMHVAGGIHLSQGAQDLWVEVATQGDPAGAHWDIFAKELLADVWMPMIPLAVLTIGVAMLTVRRSLDPLVQAAERADSLAVLDRGERLDTTGLPREASSLVAAINGLLDKVTTLIGSQRLFLARAAHELRTPLSIMLLELGHIDHARARRLESDVQAMSEMTDRLLTLSRLEATERLDIGEVDLRDLATSMVERMTDWARQSGHTLEVRVLPPAAIARADRAAVREALRNLIENAVRHSPESTLVVVEVGPGARVAVEDAGRGIDLAEVDALMQPFTRGSDRQEGAGLGLAIVSQVARLHRAELDIGRSPLGGARVELTFPGSPP
jgi:two-component system sensor histidine kinase QseC